MSEQNSNSTKHFNTTFHKYNIRNRKPHKYNTRQHHSKGCMQDNNLVTNARNSNIGTPLNKAPTTITTTPTTPTESCPTPKHSNCVGNVTLPPKVLNPYKQRNSSTFANDPIPDASKSMPVPVIISPITRTVYQIVYVDECSFYRPGAPYYKLH